MFAAFVEPVVTTMGKVSIVGGVNVTEGRFDESGLKVHGSCFNAGRIEYRYALIPKHSLEYCRKLAG
jgi:hypothetical protein